MKGFFVKLLFSFISVILIIVMLSGCQSSVSDKPACPARQVDTWIEESRIVLRENVEVMGMYENANSKSELQAVVRAAEQVYKHQLLIESPQCLKRLDELSEDQYYWMWKYYDAIYKGKLNEAEDYYAKAMTAMKAGDRESDRVAQEQGW